MTYDSCKATKEIKDILGIFDVVGVASKQSVEDAPDEFHPRNIMPDFESVIVYAQGKSKPDTSSMGGFDNYLETVFAETEVLEFLNDLGFKAEIVGGCDSRISLVKMGEAAGVGEVSSVNSLVVKGHGLTTSIAAIVTNAKLEQEQRADNVCIHCNKCLKVCPIREAAFANGDLEMCGCGKCVNVCPV